MNQALIKDENLITEQFQRLEDGHVQKLTSIDEIIGDRVYAFPEGLPASALDLFINLLSEDDVSGKDIDYLYFILVTLPQMAHSTGEVENFADQHLSFKEYVKFQMSRMQSHTERGLSAEFCLKVRTLLGRFAEL